MGCGDETEIEIEIEIEEINSGFGISEKERPWNGMTTQVQSQRSITRLIRQIAKPPRFRRSTVQRV